MQEVNVALKKGIEKQGSQTKELDVKRFKLLCDKVLTPEFSLFIKVQIDLLNRSSHGRRYSDEFKKFSYRCTF